jgi:formylglycine-generating enzyme required for sulfatase activity
MTMSAGLAWMLSTSEEPNAKDRLLSRFMEEFVSLTPGQGRYPASFEMGSKGDAPAAEKPAHVVTLGVPFSMAKYEVTQELYEAVMGNNPSRWKGPRNSVEMVNWTEAGEFCRKLTQELQRLGKLPANEVIRLPSEAEWEYACRAGTVTRYSFGDDAAKLGEFAWFAGNSKGEDPPVGKKKPNAWDLYDMHGYVWEWCQDAWQENYNGAPADGRAWEEASAKARVLRGGSWADAADLARSAYRHRLPGDSRSDRVGFRCVRAKRAN